MPQKNINIRKKGSNIDQLPSVWWKPLFSAQKDAVQACKQACSDIAPANEFWKTQDELLDDAQNQIHRFFGEIFNTRQMAMPWFTGRNTEPYLDITENGKAFKVRAELPGVKESDLKIAITDGGLVIQGEKSEERNEQDERTLHSECRYGFFSRTIALPEEGDLDKAEAHFENNILTVEIPKKSGALRRSLKMQSDQKKPEKKAA